MKKLIILFLSTVLLSSCNNTNTKVSEFAERFAVRDSTLEGKLETILRRDQAIRRLMDARISDETRAKTLSYLNLSESELKSNSVYFFMNLIDSINQVAVDKIISEHGYPGKSKVKSPWHKTVFYVAQHSGNIEKYLPLIEKAANHGELEKKNWAMMYDRYLMDNNKTQIYGTQVWGQKTKDGGWIEFVWPLQYPDSVNQLRKEVGIENTIEEMCANFEMDYKIYTLEEALELKKSSK